MPNCNMPKINKFFAFVLILTGLVFISFIVFHSDTKLLLKQIRMVLVAGAVALFLLSIILLKTKITPYPVISISVFCLLYLLLEMSVNVIGWYSPTYPSFNAFNKSCASYNPLVGYKWKPSERCRMVRVDAGEVLYDNKFSTNNMGYISKYNYSNSKKDTAVKRFMVLGDSFTSGEFIETPWPDKIQELLNKDSINNVEIYSFGVNGGGLANWCAVFFNEIVPIYEFDGVIIADFKDDLFRDYMVFHMDGEFAYTGYLNELPDSNSSMDDRIKNNFSKTFYILDDSIIDEMIRNRNELSFFHPTIPSLHVVTRISQAISSYYYQHFVESKVIANSTSMEEWMNLYYGKKLDRLDQIIHHCRKKNKQIILASIPTKQGASRTDFENRGMTKTIHQLELEFIAGKHGIPYFDSYPDFQQLSDSAKDAHWLKYDGHWNQKGADLFANKFHNYFLREILNR